VQEFGASRRREGLEALSDTTFELIGPHGRRLRRRTVARVRADEVVWAKLAREFGISASARAYGITASSMLKRVQRIERRGQ
jgi:hypothetical protein